MPINTCLSIITLNFNGVNVPTKRHRGTDWIKQTKTIKKKIQKFTICCPQETHFSKGHT